MPGLSAIICGLGRVRRGYRCPTVDLPARQVQPALLELQAQRVQLVQRARRVLPATRVHKVLKVTRVTKATRATRVHKDQSVTPALLEPKVFQARLGRLARLALLEQQVRPGRKVRLGLPVRLEQLEPLPQCLGLLARQVHRVRLEQRARLEKLGRKVHKVFRV